MARPSSFDDLLGNFRRAFPDQGHLILNGKRVPVPKYHDCHYVRCRTALVPTAEQIANELGNGDPYAFTRIFVETMEELTKRCL